jgi:hypothetical protein
MAGDTPLTAAEAADLRAISGVIIPSSAEFDVPGADDPAIQADMLATLGRDTAPVREALGQLVRFADGPFAALDAARREAAGLKLRTEGGPAVATLVRVVLQCYYRDDRVVRSLGLEPRAPHPLGHELEQGDWSLLDTVRAREPFWRRA